MTARRGFIDEPVVVCDGLTFGYRRTAVLDGVSLRLQTGITGLLGPNGAGKSTLMDIIATQRVPWAGSISIAGHPVETDQQIRWARQRLGYLPQRFDLMAASSCRYNVAYAAWCRGVAPKDCWAAADQALAVVNLGERAADKVGALSGGQKQRLGIACAIAHQPAVLLLDEPTVGLDPAQRIEMRHYLSVIAAQTCVLLSTHIVDDLSLLSAQVIVLDKGAIRFTGSVSDFQARATATADGVGTLESAYLAVLGGEPSNV